MAKYERDSSGSKKGKVIALDVQEIYDLQNENLSPVRWFVRDLLPQGLSTNVAPPKFGKSWWALDLALSVAAGDKFMGFQTEKTEVLYCQRQLENAGFCRKGMSFFVGLKPVKP